MKFLRLCTVLLFSGLVACGDSDPTNPTGGPVFPLLAQGIIDGNCLRGETPPPASLPGTLVNTDCPTAGSAVGVSGGGGFFEGWRVRVSTAATVNFVVTSEFDSFLDLFSIDLVALTPSLLAFDDDSAGNFDAALSFTLQPDTEYWIMVSGLDAEELGSYTLAIN